ncbi:type IV pilus modification protein PilV [Haliea sp. E17]|uniref:type IV pilus modification protein PilV n=1 Tax=Haliea sp. E17 TaxID=3401576 RepID=UPI003AAC35C0
MRYGICHRKSAHGFTLIEVLITLVILAIGLLGLAGLQIFSLQSQMEAYQRGQAVMLAEEMAKRMQVNAPAARDGEYTEGEQYGLLPAQVCDPAALSTADYDLCDWNNILAGQGVALAGINVGSIAAARGCIENIAGSADGETRIRVTVAWQGNAATQAPGSPCGTGQYGADDAYRRVAIVDAVFADLLEDPNSP